MLILVGVLAIVAGTLLISPDVRNTLWSVRTRVGRAGTADAGYPPAFEERLMTVAIVVALVGVGLVVAGFVRAG
jgi:hypothetical protein